MRLSPGACGYSIPIRDRGRDLSNSTKGGTTTKLMVILKCNEGRDFIDRSAKFHCAQKKMMF